MPVDPPPVDPLAPPAAPVRDALVLGAVPTLVALAVVAFAVIERATVDPTVSAGFEGESAVPVWYVPLAVFAVANSLALALTPPAPPARRAIGVLLVVAAAAFLLTGAPILIAEFTQGLFMVLIYLVVLTVVLWPFLSLACLALAGALFGLAIHLPAAVAGRGGVGAPALRDLGRTPLVLAGVAVAVIYVIVFGAPTRAERMARGRSVVAETDVVAAWRSVATVIALCCALLAVAGAWTFGRLRTARAAWAWLAVFALPIGCLALFGGPLVRAAAEAPTLRSLAATPPLAWLSDFVRDGRPRAREPVRLAGHTLAVERALLLYQLADNPQRRVGTAAFRPTPELLALGVRDRTEPFTAATVVLNGWRAEARRRDAESAGATCAENVARGLIECRHRGQDAVAIEIDARAPSRSFTPGDCRLRFDDVGGRGVSAFVTLDCRAPETWRERAAAIETTLAALLR
jgi:uncharacterized SAM-binding protein YcdF (DUF218 family)